MARRSRRDRLSQYTVYVTPAVLREIRGLPGNARQRVKRAVEGLSNDPRPSESRALSIPGVESEIRRLRLDEWRIVYAVAEPEQAVDVLAVRRRPPYDYGDLQGLIVDSLQP